jgi:sensor histidine kinase YesM
LFSKIEKKIVLTMVITISFCTILSSVVTYIIIRKNIFKSFIPLAIQSAEQQKNNLDLFLDLTTESSKLLASDPEIIGILARSHVKNIEFLNTIAKLNDIQASNLNIIGLTLYGMNGIFYPSNPSNNTANSTPDLKQILRDPLIRNFIRQPGKALWYDRFQKDYWITDLTLNLRLYKGVFTFVQKINDPNGSLTGLLMTDIAIDSLYEHFRNNQFNADTYFYSSRRGILARPLYGKPLRKQETKEILDKLKVRTGHSNSSSNPNGRPLFFHTLSNDGRNIILYHRLPHSFDFVIRVIPLANILNQIHRLLFFLVFINVLLILLAIFLGLAISKSISLPLGQLYAKMQKFTKL